MKLSDFEQQLKSAENLTQLQQVLCRHLEQLQFSIYAFTYYSHHPTSAHKIKYQLASSRYKSWHQHYVSEEYENVDSTMDYIHRHTLPTLWEIREQLKNAKTPREQQMRLDSIEFGVEKGLSIPIHGPYEDFAVLVVSQMRGEHCLEHWQDLQYNLFMIGYLFYNHLQKFLGELQPDENYYQLTPRELQVLLLAAKDSSAKEIANKLAITERTVHFHMQKINRKFGVKNKHQAVAKALAKGIISL